MNVICSFSARSHFLTKLLLSYLLFEPEYFWTLEAQSYILPCRTLFLAFFKLAFFHSTSHFFHYSCLTLLCFSKKMIIQEAIALARQSG
jgi:hypothetical protein